MVLAAGSAISVMHTGRKPGTLTATAMGHDYCNGTQSQTHMYPLNTMYAHRKHVHRHSLCNESRVKAHTGALG